jgi:hypothetical protein
MSLRSSWCLSCLGRPLLVAQKKGLLIQYRKNENVTQMLTVKLNDIQTVIYRILRAGGATKEDTDFQRISDRSQPMWG